MSRSPITLEPHVPPECQRNFLQHFWYLFSQKSSAHLCTEPSWLQVRPNQKVMHNAYGNVNHKPLLVAVNRCNMKVCFHPNMAVENPSQMKQASSMNNTIAGKLASLCCRAQVSPQIGPDKGNRGLEPAPSANGKDRTAAHLQYST